MQLKSFHLNRKSQDTNLGGDSGVDLISPYLEARKIKIDKNMLKNIIEDAWSLSEEERLRILCRITQQVKIISSDRDFEYLSRVYKVYKKITQSAILNYIPEFYDDRLVVLRSIQNMEAYRKKSYSWQMWMNSLIKGKRGDKSKSLSIIKNNLTLGWDKYCDKIAVHDVPGNHFTMLRPPHVKILAEKIKEYLK